MVKEREKKDLPRNREKIVCLKNHSTRDALFKSHRGSSLHVLFHKVGPLYI